MGERPEHPKVPWGSEEHPQEETKQNTGSKPEMTGTQAGVPGKRTRSRNKKEGKRDREGKAQIRISGPGAGETA